MTTTGMLRLAYRAIVRLHPADFRERFGEEMIWIFEEESRRGRGGRLLLEGIVSLARQSLRGEEEMAAVGAGFGLLPVGLRTGPRRMVQGGFALAILLAAAMLLVGPRGGWGFDCPPAAPEPARAALHAPWRIEALSSAERADAAAGAQSGPARHRTLYYPGKRQGGGPCLEISSGPPGKR
jgi:hypothetical protein